MIRDSFKNRGKTVEVVTLPKWRPRGQPRTEMLESLGFAVIEEQEFASLEEIKQRRFREGGSEEGPKR